MYLTDFRCNPIKGEVNVDGRYTYHHHSGHNKSMAAKEFTKKQRKSMIKLKKYTGSVSKKTKRTSTSSRVGI
jgi:hypothetical protein